MKIDLKSKNGFSTIDLAFAMFVIILFVAIMTSYLYNVYLSSTEAKRTATALNYAVDIFENIGRLNFSEITANSPSILVIDSIKDLKVENRMAETINASIGTYNITLKIEPYREGTKIKIITLTIDYPVAKNKPNEKVELQRLKIDDAQRQVI